MSAKKKTIKFFAATCLAVVLVFMNSSAFFFNQKASADSSTTSIIVHFHRYDSNYTNWDLWMWPYQPVNGDGAAYEFTGPTDDFGVTANVQVPGNNSQVGLIVRKNDWSEKNSPDNTYIDLSKGHEVWVVQGDPTIYYSKSDAEAASKPAISSAYLDGKNKVTAKLNAPLVLTNDTSQFSVLDQTAHKWISATSVKSGNTGSNATDLLNITLSKNPDVRHSLLLEVKGYKAKSILPRSVLDLAQYQYKGNDLGNTFTKKSTAFRVWAPTAEDVHLLLFNSENGKVTKKLNMEQGKGGTWKLKVKGNLNNWYYLYEVKVNGQTQDAVDPYVRAISVNGSRGMIVDLQQTNPAGWQKDRH
ncbi:pullulanase-associated domain-containing protein [Heyndrickxia acidicola]|uniref:Pullulanase-associated domain-containing protein n=1 Tax=Heyndrickxia acidicola TaxID=209389 RepID=A0ABU6MH42_9BACI|nr:pullulanase-associated domain-containing protein [Heyndrickxia acidicola]MED1203989.1 pullulanase-associated domain-containing protein [Heyndrickxia acidicola]